jgi:hypothetical protein
MNDHDPERAEAIHQIAALLAAAYVRLRFPESPQKAVDCPKRKSGLWTVS